MKEYQLEKIINIQYLDENKEWRIKDVPIYAIPINKKGYCKPFVEMENKKGEVNRIPICAEYYNQKYCNKCVNTAKKLYRMNREQC